VNKQCNYHHNRLYKNTYCTHTHTINAIYTKNEKCKKGKYNNTIKIRNHWKSARWQLLRLANNCHHLILRQQQWPDFDSNTQMFSVQCHQTYAMIAKKESTLNNNTRQRQDMTEELKRSDAFSPTTFKNTPKTIISSNSNSVQISVSQWPQPC